MMKDKLFNKFFFTTFCIIILSLAAMVLILCFFVSNFLSNDKKNTLFENCDSTAKILQLEDSIKIDDRVSMILSTLSSNSKAEIFISDPNGTVVFCSCEGWAKNRVCVHSENRVSEHMLALAHNDKYFAVTDLDGMLAERVYCSAVDVRNDNNDVFANVFAVSPTSSLKYFYSQMLKMLGLSAIFPLVLLFLAEYWQVYRIRKPLKSMSFAAKCVARGDFSKRIPVISNDEIGELSVSFNQMTNALVRMEEMRRSFIANVSHELKTPMTTISGFIDGIIDGTIEKERQDYYLHIISDEIKRLSRLVQSMLSLSRLESGETKISAQRFELNETIFSILLAQEQRIESKNINILGLDTIGRIHVMADRDLIHQVVYNLVDNAVKFTDENGTISFSARQENGQVFVSIRNTGKGIPNKELPYVFERFYKIDRSRSANKDSTGLGLYIVKTIIAIHSGRISVSSIENEYTEFTFSLPMSLN